MRVLLSGGGTAGHVYPALTVAGRLLASGRDTVAFVGTPDGLEARLVPEAGIDFVPLAARGFDRANLLSLPIAVAVLLASTVRAFGLIGRWRPDVVVGFGGYVSLPVGAAAVLRRVPIVLHEQNSVPGVANRWLSRWARAVGVTYEGSAQLLRHPERASVTGNPVRDEVLAAERAAGRAALHLPPAALVVLVFGGSQGARHLNQALAALYPRLAEVPGLHVLHVAGSLDFDAARERLEAARQATARAPEEWRTFEYLEQMASALAAADLVVARAGATSIAEITAVGRAAVLVPYPYATGDHQTRNAAAVAEAGACIMVSDAELDTPRFGEAVLGLLGDPEGRERMAAASAALGRRDAAERVADLARAAAAGTSRRPGA